MAIAFASIVKIKKIKCAANELFCQKFGFCHVACYLRRPLFKVN